MIRNSQYILLVNLKGTESGELELLEFLLNKKDRDYRAPTRPAPRQAGQRRRLQLG